MTEFTLRQLQYFQATVEEGSITEAAARCHVTQAAISMAIGQLERALDTPLFIRSHAKCVVPTAAGVTLMEYARNVHTLLDEARTAVLEEKDRLRGPLRIGCTTTISPHVVPALLAHFSQEFPEVELSVREDDAVSLSRDVEAGRLDFALCYEIQRPHDLDYQLIRHTRQHVALSADHPLADAEEVWLADLIEEPLVLFDIAPTVQSVLAMLHTLGLKPKLWWSTPVAETLRAVVARGLAWSVINLPPAQRFSVENIPLVYVPIADELPDNPVVAVLPNEAHVPTRVQAAIDYLADLHCDGDGATRLTRQIPSFS
ncbi:LysR family transcriptional regulator [Micrococcoides hystricis]|uniref:LysR family transcriptional regulator n=1 Tax=Micrococcoides hystricis TaxID=1572761 RepID=A0ABV6PAP5_9MICC